MSYVEATDTSLRKTGQIKLHGPSAFAGMRKAGALVAKCLDELTDIVGPGVPTERIDQFVRDFAFSHGAYPATLMYRGYRYSTSPSSTTAGMAIPAGCTRSARSRARPSG
jgi:methionyl aminopeptidase